MSDLFAQLPPIALLAAICVTLVAGFVKGAIGFAMPLIMISGLSLFIDPFLAIAAIILPITVTNILQATRSGVAEMRSAAVEHWRYILIVCVMILLVAQLVTLIPQRMFYLALGVPVVALSTIQLLGLRFTIPQNRRRVAEWGVGALSGALGGLTGTWGPPTVLYLMALGTPRARAILVQGVVYGLGSVSLLLGHIQSGVLNSRTWPLSALLLVPALIGQAVGFRAGDRMDAELFRKVTLAVLIVAGLNLVRRGLAG
ncbi:TSUP family transporter [Rhodobacterales bacterium HKCCE3408]|nr:TSUP family transporter [Rhodobacterales bacterium HKCCE3408]